jgi:hypothetical protein
MIFTPLFLLAMVVFTIKVFTTASSAYEDKIERLCAPKPESNWGFFAPPMEKTNVRNNTETSTEALCESRRKSDGSTDGARHPE